MRFFRMRFFCTRYKMLINADKHRRRRIWQRKYSYEMNGLLMEQVFFILFHALHKNSVPNKTHFRVIIVYRIHKLLEYLRWKCDIRSKTGWTSQHKYVLISSSFSRSQSIMDNRERIRIDLRNTGSNIVNIVRLCTCTIGFESDLEFAAHGDQYNSL